MSVRTDQNMAGMPQQMHVPGTNVPATAGAMDALATINAAQAADSPLAESNDFNTINPDHPLKRTVVATIRASLDDLCLRKAKSVWAPSPEALQAIFRQTKFTDLTGATEAQGDLKSIVLHKITQRNAKSTFPIALGAKVSGVDDKTYAITGEAFSSVILPDASVDTATLLQEDPVGLDLTEKGIHEVQARRFCLVAADHPLVSAISENAEKLQMGEISMMPEGLVKISTNLYETIMPMVKSQVESQIKVRDFSGASVSIAPAEFGTWAEARTEIMAEQKTALKAKLEAELGAVTEAAAIEELRALYTGKERELEHSVDHTVHTFAVTLDIDYNFLSLGPQQK